MAMTKTLMNSHNLNYLKLYLFVQFNNEKLKVCVYCVTNTDILEQLH